MFERVRGVIEFFEFFEFFDHHLSEFNLYAVVLFEDQMFELTQLSDNLNNMLTFHTTGLAND